MVVKKREENDISNDYLCNKDFRDSRINFKNKVENDKKVEVEENKIESIFPGMNNNNGNINDDENEIENPNEIQIEKNIINNQIKNEKEKQMRVGINQPAATNESHLTQNSNNKYSKKNLEGEEDENFKELKINIKNPNYKKYNESIENKNIEKEEEVINHSEIIKNNLEAIKQQIAEQEMIKLEEIEIERKIKKENNEKLLSKLNSTEILKKFFFEYKMNFSSLKILLVYFLPFCGNIKKERYLFFMLIETLKTKLDISEIYRQSINFSKFKEYYFTPEQKYLLEIDTKLTVNDLLYDKKEIKHLSSDANHSIANVDRLAGSLKKCINEGGYFNERISKHFLSLN